MCIRDRFLGRRLDTRYLARQMKRIEFRPEAIEEAQEAYEWYKERNFAVSNRFKVLLEEKIVQISESPHLFKQDIESTRRGLLGRFPYKIIFKKYKEYILIIAVAHGNRSPGYWRNRIG